MIKANLAYTIVGAVLMLLSFVGGCSYHKKTFQCPTITHDTITIRDTVTHTIPSYYPYYIQGKNTVIHDTIPQNIDTVVILHDYYNRHVYNRKWENDTLDVHLTDTISRNTPIGSLFSYKIKVSFTTINNSIDNSIHYTKYLYAGATYDIKIKSLSFNAYFATPKILYGIGYTPNTNSFSATLSAKLFQIK
jgi:hypothetical protein